MYPVNALYFVVFAVFVCCTYIFRFTGTPIQKYENVIMCTWKWKNRCEQYSLFPNKESTPPATSGYHLLYMSPIMADLELYRAIHQAMPQSWRNSYIWTGYYFPLLPCHRICIVCMENRYPSLITWSGPTFTWYPPLAQLGWFETVG